MDRRKSSSVKTSSSTAPQRCHHSQTSIPTTRSLSTNRWIRHLTLPLLLLQLVFAPRSCMADDVDPVLEDQREIACFDLLNAADGDLDLQLNESEYLTFLQSRFAGCPAYANATELTDGQKLAFTTTACTCIAVTFDFDCCDPPLWDLPANNTGDLILTGMCLAATTAAVADGCDFWDILDDVASDVFGNTTDDGEGTDTDAPYASPVDGNDEPAQDQDEEQQREIVCFDLLNDADGNFDRQLNESEYLKFLQSRFAGCPAYENATELTGGQKLAFTTTACTCIVTTFELDCCDPPLWYLPANNTGGFEQTGMCLAATTAAVTDGCDFWDILGDVASDVFGNGTDIGGENDAPYASPFTTDESCFQDLDAADLDRDGLLDETEYLQFVQTRIYDDKTKYPDCDAPGEAQSSIFQTLACATCVFDGTCDSCGTFLNITGVEQPDALDFFQRAGLVGICVAAETTAAVECAFPDNGTNVTLPPEDGEDDLCAENLKSVDVDNNSFLNETEYAAFVAEYYTDPECIYNSTGDGTGLLSPAQSAAFDALACASCLVDPDCGCGTDKARVSIAVAVEVPTVLENIRLQTICAGAQTASDLECQKISDDSDSPSPTQITMVPSPPVESPVAVPTPPSSPTAPVPAPTVANAPQTTANGIEVSDSSTSSSWLRSTNQLSTSGMALVLVFLGMV